MTASAWLTRGRKSSDPINALADYWRGFNNLFASEKGHERTKIRRLLERKLSSQSAAGLLEAHGREIRYLISRPVIDMRGNGRSTAAQIEAFATSGGAVEKVVQLFMIIYQVRCNLEHGQKHPHRDRDILLCAVSAPLVAAAIGLCETGPA